MIKREKRRYLAVRVVGNQMLNEKTVLDIVYASVQRLFGEHGASQTNLRMMKHDPEKNQFVIRCSHKMLEQVRAAIASVTEMNGEAVAFHVVAVSGTLKALAKKA
ncbi:MAG: Rpp14/Pop5 family protein [Candidatus Bathyarchaeota archaeon]|nr:Rpp14/Pop5 family protein [Candidatus Bathyarchaeota archaeon]